MLSVTQYLEKNVFKSNNKMNKCKFYLSILSKSFFSIMITIIEKIKDKIEVPHNFN